MKRLALVAVVASLSFAGAAQADDPPPAPPPPVEAPPTPPVAAPPVQAPPPPPVQAPPPPPPVEAPPPSDEAPPLATWRLALLPVLGGGIAGMTSKSVFPSFIGTSILGGEIDYGLERIGGFARVQFQSSGQDGRWTAMSYTLGASYRLAGDGFASIGSVVRAGLSYEHWRASTGGCDVVLFVPASCKDFVPPPGAGGNETPPPRTDVVNDVLGIVGGMRFEMPVQAFYLALDTELGAGTSVSSGAPGVLFQARAAIVFAFRNRRSGDVTIEPSFRPRPPRGTTY